MENAITLTCTDDGNFDNRCWSTEFKRCENYEQQGEVRRVEILNNGKEGMPNFLKENIAHNVYLDVPKGI